MTLYSHFKRLPALLLACLMGFFGCSPNHHSIEEELKEQSVVLKFGDPLNSTPGGEVSCEGNVLYSVPYDASQWGPLPNNNLSVRVYPQATEPPIEAGCNCREIAYFVVFDMPQSAIQHGVVLQPSTSMSPMNYEPFVVQESPSTTPLAGWIPPQVTMDPYPLVLPETVEMMFEVGEDFPIGPNPENRVARVIGICIVGDIPDIGPDAVWIGFEHAIGL